MITQQDLIWELLVRVPTKSLMRFKFVSKLWYSIIRNPKFAIAHYNNGGASFGGLLIIDIHYHIAGYLLQKLSYVNLNDECPRLMQHHFPIRRSQLFSFTSVVKGLMGLYNEDRFTLCNIATQELLKLPPTPPRSSYGGVVNHFYYLGFDPVEEVYKVLNICFFFDEYIAPTFRSHVFTLGFNYSDMNWRKTIAPMSFGLYFQSQQCLCINGVLYLRCKVDGAQQTLTVFHLNSETFEIIAIPECIRSGGVDLVEISGRPALVTITSSDGMMDVWTMNNNHRGLGELEAWARKKVWLPINSNILSKVNYVGTLPTGEIMLAESELHNFPFALYIYDHLKNKLKSITINDFRFQESDMKLQVRKICYYEENIISLAFLSSQKQAVGSNN